MDINNFYKQFDFICSLSYVSIISTILTLIVMEIIKKILKKKDILNELLNKVKKDNLLKILGRIVSLLMYVSVYLINEIIINHKVIIDKKLISSLVLGASITLALSKSIYTYIHQFVKSLKDNNVKTIILKEKEEVNEEDNIK